MQYNLHRGTSMKNDNDGDKARVRLLAAVIAMGFTTGLAAQGADKSAYWTDKDGVVARSGTNLCWRAGYWTPAAAIAECDPDLVPKPAPVAAASPPPPPPAVRAPAPAPAQRPAPVAPMMEKVSLSAQTLFDFDKAVVKPGGAKRLDELVASLATLNLEVLIAIGHTDSIGSDAYNQKLSQRRADAVKAYLVGKGIPPERVTAQGKGEREPVASNKTREGRAANRRVEIEVVGTRQKRR